MMEGDLEKGIYLTFEEFESIQGDAYSRGELSYSDKEIILTWFETLEYRARKIIDKATFGRLKSVDAVPLAVKHCMAHIITTLYFEEEKNLVSESGDGVSMTYEISKDTESKIDEHIQIFLSNEYTSDGTPLLYLGVS